MLEFVIENQANVYLNTAHFYKQRNLINFWPILA